MVTCPIITLHNVKLKPDIDIIIHRRIINYVLKNRENFQEPRAKIHLVGQIRRIFYKWTH